MVSDNFSEKAIIFIDKNTKEPTLEVLENIPWKLYAGNSIEEIDLNSNPILENSGKGFFKIKNYDKLKRKYYKFVSNSDEFFIAEKHLPMKGGYNFRDLGGIRNKDGKYIKWGKIFRADDLSKLIDEDLQYLSSIPVNCIVDFRDINEVEIAPDRFPSSMKEYHKLPIMPGNLSAVLQDVHSGKIKDFDMIETMKTLNRDLATDPECINKYKQFFEILQKEENTPLIFHCSAGKDRTGFGTALILLALNVDEKIIMADYLSSNIFLTDKYEGVKKMGKNYANLVVVKDEYLQAAINAIKEKYGTVERYLVEVLDVDINLMRKKFLEEF